MSKPFALVHDIGNYVIAAMLQSVVYHTHKLWGALNDGGKHAWERREVFEEFIGNVTDTFGPFLRHGKVRYNRFGYHYTDEDAEKGIHALVFEFEDKLCTCGELTVRSDQPRELSLVSLWSFDEKMTVITNVFEPKFMDRVEGGEDGEADS